MYFKSHVCFSFNLYILKNAKVTVKVHIKTAKK